MTDRRSSTIFHPDIVRLLLGLSMVLLAIGSVSISTAEDVAPLNNVDIVRRILSGESADDVIALIRGSASVDFDLSDEMQDELGIAGVPRPVIEAMVERQSELERANNPDLVEAEPEEEPVEDHGITILFDPDRPPAAGPSALRVIDVVPPEMKEQMGLREEQPRFTDVGLFLLCVTADHVPNHWRSHTPLGRDFVRTPRHKLLSFLSGAVSVPDPELSGRIELPEGADPPAVLRLEVPDRIDSLLEPDVAHDLVLGIALQTEGRFYMVVSSGWEGLVPTGRAVTHARVHSGDDPLELVLEVAFDHSADEGVAPPIPD